MVFRSFYLKSQKREVKQTMEMVLSVCPHIQNTAVTEGTAKETWESVAGVS